MSNTFTLYDTVTTFQKRQREAYDAYMKAMEGLETAKGSQYYTDKQREAMDARKAAEEKARAEARYWIQKTVENMKHSNLLQKAIAPTAEQVSILQAMKMRKSMTTEELDQIANAMDGNALALGVVNDYAREIGNPKNYLAKSKGGYPVSEMGKAISNIAQACESIIASDGANRAKGLAMDMHSRLHGGPSDRDSLERAEIAGSEADFYSSISTVPVETLQECLNG